MTHEELKAALSAYADGELAPEAAREISAHLRGCKECSAALAELKALSSGIKTSLAAAAPDAMKKRVLAKASPSPKANHEGAFMVLATALVAIIIVLFAGVALKKYMPALFGNIQGMINGAASSLGSSKGNN
jgi:anti-sigma factor RsiW